MPAYKPAAVLEAFQRRKITMFAGGPSALYVGLRANENFAKTDFSSLQVCLSGGAPCPEELLRSGRRQRAAVSRRHRHVGGRAHRRQSDPGRAQDRLGRRRAGRHRGRGRRSRDRRRACCRVGEPGEIRVRGPQFIMGYRNRPEETAKAIRDGWLYTGDIGYFDDDGYLFVVDRKKEMIMVGGYNVYPREIDELLFKHPAILEAATVGVPDRFSGEAVKAFVVLQARRRAAARGAAGLLPRSSSNTSCRSTSSSSTRCRDPASARSTSSR